MIDASRPRRKPPRRSICGAGSCPIGRWWLGGILFALVLVAALFAGWMAPFDPLDTDPVNALQPPGRDHWMGTDQLGRDVFSRVIHGARPSLIMGVVPMIISSIIGTAAGMIIGYYGRWADLMMTRFIDIALAFPPILLALTVVAVLGPGLWSIALALGLSGIPSMYGWPGARSFKPKRRPSFKPPSPLEPATPG